MAIKTIKLPDGRVLEIDEWLHWPQFSTFESAFTVGLDLRAFTYVTGQRVPNQGLVNRNATETDTNQVARARMNHDEAFIVFSLTYEIWGLNDAESDASPPNNLAQAPLMLPTNLRRLQRDVVVDLFVGAGITKPMARCPLSYIGQGVGPAVNTTGPAPAALINPGHGTGGRVYPQNQRRWNLPVYIESDRVMSLRAFSPVGVIAGLTQSYRIRWYLDGIKRRPIA